MVRARRYLLISPCRDEAAYIGRTLDSVAAQSVQPAAWVVVDDGSRDETPAILDAYSRRLPYLRVVRREDRGRREVGPGVVEAFYAGLETVDLDEFDYVCKLDMDLDLPAEYFETLMRRMEANPRIGSTSGKPWFVHPRSGALVPEVCGDEMSVGMTKFYRTACFREIGGFVRQVMWDGIDCHRARMLGWIAESVDQDSLRFIHLRPQGASHKGIWTGRVRKGFGQYFMGTSPVYHVAVAVYHLHAYPVLIGSAAMLWGYFRSWALALPRYDDLEFRAFLRSYQHACLRRGKRAAIARIHAERAGRWVEAHSPSRGLEDGRSAAPARQIDFLGHRFDGGTLEENVRTIFAEMDGDFRYVVTPNVHDIVTSLQQPAMMQPIYDLAWRVFCDSRILSRLAWLGGRRLPVVTGSDLTARLVARAAEKRATIALIGPSDAACDVLRRTYPGLTIRVHTPPMGFIHSELERQACVDFAIGTRADLLFIAVGMPQQAILAREIADHPQARGIGLCVGAAIDFLSGKQRRAPVWLQRAGLEWLYRLLNDPRRLAHRYLFECPRIFYLAYSQWRGKSLVGTLNHPAHGRSR